MSDDTPNGVRYGTAAGISTINRAFGCPECGHQMDTPNAGAFKLYCPKYSCQYELGHRDMTIEQKFYVKIARESDSRAKVKRRVRNWLESGEWDV